MLKRNVLAVALLASLAALSYAGHMRTVSQAARRTGPSFGAVSGWWIEAEVLRTDNGALGEATRLTPDQVRYVAPIAEAGPYVDEATAEAAMRDAGARGFYANAVGTQPRMFYPPHTIARMFLLNFP